MKEGISIENRVAMSIQNLAILYVQQERYLDGRKQNLKDCRKIGRVHVRHTFWAISKSNLVQDFHTRILGTSWDSSYKITIAICGSRITTLTHVIGGEDDYHHNSFHQALLQNIVDRKQVYWNYIFKWARFMHDWTLFQL